MQRKELNGIAGLTNAKKGLTVFVARPFLMPRLAIAISLGRFALAHKFYRRGGGRKRQLVKHDHYLQRSLLGH